MRESLRGVAVCTRRDRPSNKRRYAPLLVAPYAYTYGWPEDWRDLSSVSGIKFCLGRSVNRC